MKKSEIESLIESKKIEKLNDVDYSYVCDKCGEKIIAKFSSIAKFNGLCKKCKSIKTNLERYGVPFNSQNPSTREKAKQTSINRYGVEYYAQSDKFKKDFKDHCLEKYGVTNPSKLEITLEKIKQVWLNRYGVENISQNEDIQKRKIKTNLEKYGAPWYTSTDECKNRIKKTCLKKYGVPYVGSSKDVINKVAVTNLERYGSPSSLSSPQVREKARQTCLEKYGVENYAQTKECREKTSRKWKLMWHDMAIEKRLEIRKKASKKFKFEDVTFDSSWELALFLYLIDIGVDFEYQCDPIEYFDLDGKKHFYIPDFKIGDRLIEIKGDHFFTEEGQFINPFDRSEKMDQHCEQKYKCMKSHNVEILKSEDMAPILEHIEKVYGKDFLISCRESK